MLTQLVSSSLYLIHNQSGADPADRWGGGTNLGGGGLTYPHFQVFAQI